MSIQNLWSPESNLISVNPNCRQHCLHMAEKLNSPPTWGLPDPPPLHCQSAGGGGVLFIVLVQMKLTLCLQNPKSHCSEDAWQCHLTFPVGENLPWKRGRCIQHPVTCLCHHLRDPEVTSSHPGRWEWHWYLCTNSMVKVKFTTELLPNTKHHPNITNVMMSLSGHKYSDVDMLDGPPFCSQ